MSLRVTYRYIGMVFCLMLSVTSFAQSIVSFKELPGSFAIEHAAIYVDENDFAVVKRSAELLKEDIEKVTGYKLPLIHKVDKPWANIIAVGTVGHSSFLKTLAEKKLCNYKKIEGKWEAYQIQVVDVAKKMMPAQRVLLIAGSDRRGAAYAVFEICKQIGVSPWNWWADVPVKKNDGVYFKNDVIINDAPKVKYRGIFINDEAPALSNWSKEKFGGFNHLFYEKVFELILRLKGNYIWPAMWGNAFYDDDSLNIQMADKYGIVIGTSHHEPLMRAHDEWRRYGNKQKWNYDSTEAGLKSFWKGGMQRAWNEKIVSVGMRGDGDEPMTRETATALLERIVKDQRKIIEDVTGKPADQIPQLWALYKEVQDYYDKGMRVPDDITLLLCDDNWGNIRKLPKLEEKPRKGGYGIYYHFDYVGGPRNYKWVNTNPLPRVWEQMHLAWEYNARQIWIVNVGDIKPMELPISFFLDYAWDPDAITADSIQAYTENWAAEQFGPKYAREIGDILAKYAKYNSRRKPELLDEKTYSMNDYGEFDKVVEDYNALYIKAESIYYKLENSYRDAYFQLVIHPVKACANLNELYYTVAKNKQLLRIDPKEANENADYAKQLFIKDSLITQQYHKLNNGKWNHMMSQTHIGYTYWQQPAQQKMPDVQYAPVKTSDEHSTRVIAELYYPNAADKVPSNTGRNLFFERDSMVSMEAAHYSNAVNANGVVWKVLPDHGRTGDAITSFPVTARSHVLSENSPHVEYEFYTNSRDSFKLRLYFSPTLNFHNKPEGLQYAVSVDDKKPVIYSLNAEDTATGRGIWGKWVSENIIAKVSSEHITQPGKHVIKYWMVDSGIVLQKLVAEFGVRPTYLGPPETLKKD